MIGLPNYKKASKKDEKTVEVAEKNISYCIIV